MKHLLQASPEAPLVALVGRPNVGKSTLFNRLVGRRRALMHDEPGVTRDRLFGAFIVDDAEGREHVVRLVDTGGLEEAGTDELRLATRSQTQMAIDEAALALLVVDGERGLVPEDEVAARLLRKSGTPFVVVVNKIDVPAHELRSADFFALGAESTCGLSAEHARNLPALRDAIAAELLAADTLTEFTVRREARAYDDAPFGPDAEFGGAPNRGAPGATDDASLTIDAGERDEEGRLIDAPEPNLDPTRIEWLGGEIRVAVVGKPNAGKSSLVNALLGEERLVASSAAGTTRDAIDVACEVDGQPLIFVDTAGIRRQRSVLSRLEGLMVHVARDAMARADVVALVLDATQRVSDQDQKIASMAHEQGCGLVLVATKWDLIENPEWAEKYPVAIRHDLPFVTYAPLVTASALTGRGRSELVAAVVQAQRERHRRVSTGALNRFFRQVVDTHPPPHRGGQRPALQFVSQPMVRPPTFVVASKRPQAIAESYRRYLINAIRERFGFGGTPVWLKFREAAKRRHPAPPPPPRRGPSEHAR